MVDRELTEAALHSQGIKHALCWASTKEFFVALIYNLHFDVVLSDSGGSSFGGKEALALVRRRQPEAVFIFLTGHTKGPVFDALMRSGADGVFSKGNLPVIGATIKRTVRARRSGRD
jgi:DNA-binding NarL/FixJ family response regulator